MNNDDNRLVQECLNGHPEAYGALVERYQKPLFNTALRMVKDYDEATELTQTVFVKGYEKLTMFDPKYKFFSWIYRMLVNESLNYIKRSNRTVSLDASVPTTADQPDEAFAKERVSTRIQDALMELGVEQRILIILRHFQGLSYRELGFILDISDKKVKSRLFAARRSLHDLLKARGVLCYEG
jgi:RNA polymerase sigma-70 factor (ECF subfamily)